MPEGILHFFELIGGWPGAFVAQRRLRHKCSKPGYQAIFWLIVLMHQYAAFESYQGWKLTRAAMDRLSLRTENEQPFAVVRNLRTPAVVVFEKIDPGLSQFVAARA